MRQLERTIAVLVASGLSTLEQYRLPGGASRLAALLLAQLLPVFSVVAPGHPGAALRNPALLQRGQATRLAVAVTAAIAAPDECVSGAPQPVLDAASPKIRSHTFTITGARTAEESAILAPDLRVHVSRGGCAHFGLVYSFDVPSERPISDSRAWLRLASGLMRRVAEAESAGFASTLATSLEKQLAVGTYHYGDEIVITEGYASCVLDVTAGQQGRAAVRVSYRVVL